MNVLEEALAVVKNRQASYGKPENNFQNIATMWNTYLSARSDPIALITPTDVAMMMVLLKVARHANRPKRDNIVDIAGYAFTAETIEPSTAPTPDVPDHAPPDDFADRGKPIDPQNFQELYEKVKRENEELRRCRGLPVVGIGR